MNTSTATGRKGGISKDRAAGEGVSSNYNFAGLVSRATARRGRGRYIMYVLCAVDICSIRVYCICTMTSAESGNRKKIDKTSLQ